MKKNKGELTLEDLEQQEKIPKETAKEMEALREAVTRMKEERHYVAPIKARGNTIRFALTTDIHSGSLHERFDALHAFYEILRREKIKTVLCAGDTLDGHGMYKGQEFELHAHGVRRQLANLKKNHPGTKGIKVIAVTGNHDESFDKKVDAGIAEAISREMGWDVAGRYQAWVELMTPDGQSYHVGLYHPDGGTSYAISYKSQKFIEQIPGGQKPDMVVLGHFHKAELMPRYRNVFAIQAGCFQSQTPFMARKPTDAHVGGWIIEVTLGAREDLTSRVRAEFISFYEPEEKV